MISVTKCFRVQVRAVDLVLSQDELASLVSQGLAALGAVPMPSTELLACVHCGCSDDRACIGPDGPCHWVSLDPPVCSVCAAQDAALCEEDEAFEEWLSRLPKGRSDLSGQGQAESPTPPHSGAVPESGGAQDSPHPETSAAGSVPEPGPILRVPGGTGVETAPDAPENSADTYIGAGQPSGGAPDAGKSPEPVSMEEPGLKEEAPELPHNVQLHQAKKMVDGWHRHMEKGIEPRLIIGRHIRPCFKQFGAETIRKTLIAMGIEVESPRELPYTADKVRDLLIKRWKACMAKNKPHSLAISDLISYSRGMTAAQVRELIRENGFDVDEPLTGKERGKKISETLRKKREADEAVAVNKRPVKADPAENAHLPARPRPRPVKIERPPDRVVPPPPKVGGEPPRPQCVIHGADRFETVQAIRMIIGGHAPPAIAAEFRGALHTDKITPTAIQAFIEKNAAWLSWLKGIPLFKLQEALVALLEDLKPPTGAPKARRPDVHAEEAA